MAIRAECSSLLQHVCRHALEAGSALPKAEFAYTMRCTFTTTCRTQATGLWPVAMDTASNIVAALSCTCLQSFENMV